MHNIDSKIDEYEKRAGHKGKTHDRIIIRIEDGLDGIETKTWPVKHRFHDYRTSDQDTENKADLGNGAYKGVALLYFK